MHLAAASLTFPRLPVQLPRRLLILLCGSSSYPPTRPYPCPSAWSTYIHVVAVSPCHLLLWHAPLQFAAANVPVLKQLHVVGRVGEELFLYLGAKIGYWRGDVKGLLDDVTTLRPTIFSAVPRVFERIYGGVHAKLSGSFIKSLLYNIGYRWKIYYLNKGFRYDQVHPLLLAYCCQACAVWIRQNLTDAEEKMPPVMDILFW